MRQAYQRQPDEREQRSISQKLNRFAVRAMGFFSLSLGVMILLQCTTIAINTIARANWNRIDNGRQCRNGNGVK